ncbi:amino acid adenylation domain-containing protein [Microtetraspora sp. NBRC 16547]|uniref:non-ribosomal peptide synthetase n=1 Tax=Microtetraspora sp. NBRC 16547 TaxID=3030993 RepID=UPI0024A003B0|nr:amino acid adenylation domain-containing protein [Microtetraspora sp. NBRC 16547]GLX00432.1 peptide synthetase [Microtetraspora sp. NBRC 16547]
MAEAQFAAVHGSGDPGHREFRAEWLEESIAARFWRVVEEHPDRLAVIGDDRTLSYAELAGEVRAVAAAVKAHTSPGGRVALLLDHGPGTLAAILGTLTAGAAYVPLDPNYPAERLARMAQLAEPDLLIAGPGHRRLADALLAGAKVLDITELPPAPVAPPAEPVDVDPDAAAYILFTSGSTGRPKGVVQTHRNALFQIRTHTNNLRIGPSDRTSVLSSFSFDMAVTDSFSALLNGAAVVPVDMRRHGLTHLAEVLTERGVTIYHSTPTVYRYLLDALAADGRLPSVRAVVLGGEEVVRDDLDRFLRHFGDDCVFVNGYGATEISFAIQNHLSTADIRAGRGTGAGVVPIGFPLHGAEIELCRTGGEAAGDEGEAEGEAEGEIVIRSPHLAGYWRNPDGDQARFGVDPDGMRYYRTGDLGRRLPDGRIAYLGRLDRQVKIRGHRVELGEVEAALAALPEVARAAVVAREVRGERRIVAYVIGDPGNPVDAADAVDAVDAAALRRRLASTLPDFMLPSMIVPMKSFPLTPTGKVDAGALPAPAVPAVSAGDGASLSQQETKIGQAVAVAWCEALGVADVGWGQNFFDLGGHSLLMAQVQQRLEVSLGRRLPLTTLYTYPTVGALARHLTAQDRPDAGPDSRMARRRQARTRRSAAD